MPVVWKRLIRFVATDGRILNGEPILPSEDFDLGQVTEKDQLTAKVITGHDIFSETGDARVSDEVVTVKQLLGPLAAADIPILRCVGLNYAKHSRFPPFNSSLEGSTGSHRGPTVKEAGRTPPPFPFIFFKPNTTVIDHGAPVIIPKIAQDDQADYEGELVRLSSLARTHVLSVADAEIVSCHGERRQGRPG
jgi:hypothetical protein